MSFNSIEGAPANVLAAYKRLNEKQRALAMALPMAPSQKAAARLAGYSSKTAESKAFKLSQHPDILIVTEYVSKAAIKGAVISVQRTLQELADIVFLDPGVIFDENNCIRPIIEWPPAARRAVSSLDVIEHSNGTGRTIKVRFAGKIEAADKLLRALGAYAPDKIDQTHRVAGLAELLAKLAVTGADTGPGPAASRRYLTAA